MPLVTVADTYSDTLQEMVSREAKDLVQRRASLTAVMPEAYLLLNTIPTSSNLQESGQFT